ncbi:hypothetical protein CEUSTIGMA_g7787.t1 [Chlamydomonas eustigma]|uniref:Integrase catalytic domain-containing protein n=1 Tax=Chlamydomonas eustigma TaxID=1157962 RepID=A0A250XB95_9CHLO|nr:hypothetical protein CEUSTIGMA_g7787.t1 [Chlamydomonas eustigma]|eukprot:GAX80348.1 hypothetical protein CEUSTIGMA_g7787.t1 [Chlamydomonas eustigma]
MKELNPTNVFTERPSETYWEISQREESVDNRRENKVFAYVESLLDSTALGVHQVDEWSQMADNAKQMSAGRANIAFIYLDIIRKYFEAKEMANVRIYVKELKGKKKSANQSISDFMREIQSLNHRIREVDPRAALTDPELFHLVMDGLPMEYNGVLSTIRVLTGPTGYQPLLLLEQTLTVEESALKERNIGKYREIYHSTRDGDGGLMAGAMGQTYQPQPRPGDRHYYQHAGGSADEHSGYERRQVPPSPPHHQQRFNNHNQPRHCQVQGHFMADCPYLGKTPPSPAAGQVPAPAPAAPAAAPARQMGGDRNGMAGLLLTEPAIVLEGVCLVSFGQNTTAQKEAEHIIPPVPSQNWIVDTGSTNCNTPHRELLHDYQPLNETVRVVGGRTLQVEGMGTLHLVILTAQGPHTLVVREVRHVPGSVYNLLSGHALHTQKVASFCFQHDQPHGELRLPSPTADKLGKLPIEVPWVNGCYTLVGDPIKTDPEVSLVSTAVKEQRAAQHLHEALGHPSNEVLARGLEKGSVTGVTVNPTAIRNLPDCEECLQAKQTKGSFGESERAHMWKPGECLNVDLWGPARAETVGSHFTMYLGMKDSGSGYSAVMLLKSKEADEVVPLIIQLQKWFERQSGNQTKVIRSDRGREFFNSQLSEYCLNLGIRQEASAAHSPKQNGIAERLNRTLLEKVRAQLLNSGMHPKWWGECLRYSVNQLNCIPSSVLPNKVTPFEALFGYPPNISRFQPFGTVAFVLKLPRHAEGAGKLDPVSLKGRLVGFSNVSKAYRVLVEGHGVIESCHVRFVADSANEDAIDVGTQTGQLDQPQEAEADITIGSPDLFTYDTPDMPAADIDDTLMPAETEVEIRKSNTYLLPWVSGEGRVLWRISCSCLEKRAPTILHMDALTSVMRYVESTQYFGLEFGGVKDPCLVGYADSSYSSDPDTRRSTTGYVFLYNGGAVSWGSKLQQTVAMSTMEAEYMAAAAAAKEGLCFRKLMEELQMQQGTVHIWGDNQSALCVLKDPISSARSKHKVYGSVTFVSFLVC